MLQKTNTTLLIIKNKNKKTEECSRGVFPENYFIGKELKNMLTEEFVSIECSLDGKLSSVSSV